MRPLVTILLMIALVSVGMGKPLLAGLEDQTVAANCLLQHHEFDSGTAIPDAPVGRDSRNTTSEMTLCCHLLAAVATAAVEPFPGLVAQLAPVPDRLAFAASALPAPFLPRMGSPG